MWIPGQGQVRLNVSHRSLADTPHILTIYFLLLGFIVTDTRMLIADNLWDTGISLMVQPISSLSAQRGLQPGYQAE